MWTSVDRNFWVSPFLSGGLRVFLICNLSPSYVNLQLFTLNSFLSLNTKKILKWRYSFRRNACQTVILPNTQHSTERKTAPRAMDGSREMSQRCELFPRQCFKGHSSSCELMTSSLPWGEDMYLATWHSLQCNSAIHWRIQNLFSFPSQHLAYTLCERHWSHVILFPG